jgi:copper chaperone
MYRFQVMGMSCEHCVRTVTQAVKDVDPNAAVDIDLARREVAVESSADADRIATAIGQAGYTLVGRPA